MKQTLRRIFRRLKNAKPADLGKAIRYIKSHGLRATVERLRRSQTPIITDETYTRWIALNETLTAEQMKSEIEQFHYLPLICVAVPVYNAPTTWLARCLDSVLEQSYPYWELCIADDCSTDPSVKQVLNAYQEKDERIKVVFRQENGHISRATNSAIELATGEFIALMDNDDELPANALFEIAKVLNENPDADLIYSDEDKIDVHGVRSDPAFKPDWSPDLLLATNYISHLSVYRRSILDEIGGFRAGFEGSQDYDLVLRFTEQTDSSHILHIPKVLYHWRMLETSTAADQSTKMYAFENGLKAVQEALDRSQVKGTAKHAAGWGLYDVTYDLLAEDLVSIIIPTRDGYDYTKRAIDSIIDKTTYQNYEIVLADNGSTDQRMFELYESYGLTLGERFRMLSIDIPFNYSRINNLAARQARGKYLLFLNNDTEVIAPNWLTTMVSFAQFDRVGVIGAKLYYPTDQIQHAGVVLGLGGVAGHPHHMYNRSEFGYFGKLQVNVNYYALTAACAMVKKSDFEAVGGFDETLEVAYNDVDLSIKIHNLGRDNVFAHAAELYHFESLTRGTDVPPEKAKRLEEESQKMYARYSQIIERDPYFNPNLSRKSGSFLINLDDEA